MSANLLTRPLSSPIGVVNVGLGNVGSVQRMLQRIGVSWTDVSSPKECIKSRALILPGVGHFDSGMRKLQDAGLDDGLKEFAIKVGGPVLGICLGMQLLTRYSEEGSLPGLGLVNAEVRRFKTSSDKPIRIPHMGWNVVRPVVENPLIPMLEQEQRFYFVHSYRVDPIDTTVKIAVADYGGEFCAAFQKNNIFGVQFHPEKSHNFGMSLMQRFIEYRAC